MFLQYLVNGFTAGVMYSLVALGYSMIFGVLRMINFSHGDTMMFGTFIGLTLVKVGHWPLWLAVPTAIVITALLGVLVELLAFRPLRLADRLSPLLGSLGVAMIVSTLAQIIWGNSTQPFPTGMSMKAVRWGPVTFSTMQPAIIGICLVIMLLLYLFVQRSKLGLAMRAVSHDIQLAGLMGINVNRVISLTFAISAGLAAMAGLMIGIYYDAVYPTMGYMAGLKGFAATVLGGLGSIPGAMIGGVLIGMLEGLAGGYISTGYMDAIAFLVLILMLILRPSGLLGRNFQQKV